MKKLFTLLILLAAFFAIPRSAQAVFWETSDGTQWRINPNNPSDPNDSILIPAGTKFLRVMCATYNNDVNNVSVVERNDYYLDGGISRHHVTCYTPSGGYLYSYYTYYYYTKLNSNIELSKLDINFSSDALRLRLAERILGYDYLRITYDGGSLKNVLTNAPSVQVRLRNLRYLYKIVLTEEEVLSTTSLNFDPQEYGITNVVGIRRIDGLEVFQNLQELYLQHNHYLGQIHNTFSQLENRYSPYVPDFSVFPKLKVLDLSEINEKENYVILDGYTVNNAIYGYKYIDYKFGEVVFSRFPESIEHLYLRNSKVIANLRIPDECNNLKVIDATGNTALGSITVHSSSLDTLLVAGCSKLSVLNCRNCNLTELDFTGCIGLKELYCYDNVLESLTFGSSHPYLSHVECQNNNLTSLSFNMDNVPTPEYVFYYPYNYLDYDGGEYGTEYVFENYHIETSGDTLYVWSKKEFTTNYWNYAYDEPPYIDGVGYVWYTSKTRVTNPSIPVQYVWTNLSSTKKQLTYLDCSENNLTTLNLPGADGLKNLYCYNNKLTELDLTDCTSLQRLRMSHNKIPQIDVSNCKELIDIYAKNRIGEPGFAGWNHGLTSLDCSGLTKLTEVRLSRNKMTSLNMSGCSSLRILTCDNQGGSDARTLEVLNLTGCSNLNTLDCQNNALTSLDLSTCTRLAASGVKAYVQRSEKDVKVIDRDKVCIELVNGVTPAIANNGTISDTHMDDYFGTWTGSGFDKERNKVIKRDGKTYLVIYDISDDARGGKQREYDVDLYGNKLKYQYAISGNSWDETLGGSLANSKKNDNVTVTIYPYVMYINPISKDIHSEEVTQQGKEPFYSGTIYLDYDAIVPAGATAYIAKRIKINQDLIYSTAGGGHQKVTADQLQLVPLVAGEGASEVVIPAYTPVYVKSATEFGLFSFDRNNHGGIEQALGYAQDGSHLTRDNILKGVLTDSAITKYSVLSLGRGRPKGSDDNGYSTESRIGFWPFSGTTIPAHRVFIPISELENAGGSSSPGLLFSFTDDIDENNTTDIRTAVISKDNGWYTIGGIRLSGRPTEKGIYIHNGRKEVIR